MSSRFIHALLTGSALTSTLLTSTAGATDRNLEEDTRILAALDTEYQAAVERNDADTMARILHDDFVLVLGDGRSYTRNDLLDSARERHVVYEHQVEDPGTQVVRVWGDTAVITARLWLKGTQAGKPIERRLWFSDTYVRTENGWRYAFGQASLALPPEQAGDGHSTRD